MCLIGKTAILITFWKSGSSFGCLKIAPDDLGGFCHSQTYGIDANFIQWLFEFTPPYSKHDHGDTNLGWCTRLKVSVCAPQQIWVTVQHKLSTSLGQDREGAWLGTGSVWVRGIELCENIQVFCLLHLHPDILETVLIITVNLFPVLSSHWCTEVTVLSLPDTEFSNMSI